MLKEFKEYIEQNGLIRENEKILLAVSGGIDSMVMTDLFIRAGQEIGIAHCNFTLRGEESQADEEFVAKYAADHNIGFFSVRFDTRAYASEKGISIQMAARDLRYSWFEKTREKQGFDLIAIAHNLNDNIETFLINLVRGTGITGLSGIRKTRDRVIRPLLFAGRKSIEDYSKTNGIPYREDSSNTDTGYVRNRIRHLVLPLLAEINPSVENALNDTSKRLSEINEVFTAFTADLRKKLIRKDDSLLIIDLEKLEPFISSNAVMFELFRPFGITSALLCDLLNVISGQTGSGIRTLSHRIIKNRNELIISETTPKQSITRQFNTIGELSACPFISSVREQNVSGSYSIPSSGNTAWFDREKITFPLTIRNWQHGDYFFPLGMQHRKKLSDFLTDIKESLFTKENTLVLVSGGEIAWVMGKRIDDRFKVTGKTRKVLEITVKS
ncbi:MAG TPA: tRNA lysidine(34) synthetase TilS [Bacteroidales bacterium]|jgi:tRNA(Ile)-lysidine synthase|nr:tRNA lysidine(34) synthetase TilS [Bacteroidales bacterium]HQJ82861.1 tRNA lysidine(34) synthetase TilS [Bacteroidales bacterium]